jgi:pimeloyl-ACP methyl ester carboxylesterase
LVDGDSTQIDYIKKAAQAHGVSVVMILDIIHALEYLWKAAKVRFALDDPQAAPWVAEQIERLLHGQVRPLVRSLRRWATVQGLSPKQREPIDQCTTSLANHIPYLNYPDYLAKGYPIATGVIEGACRYLVKDRMEITGARWGLEGGEAVLKLRALVINGDFDAYWTFHETQEYQRNHQAKFAEMPPARAHLKLVSGGKNG